MTRSMTRWALVGSMALAAMSAVALFDVGARTAEAAPSVSPFAGTYDWDLLRMTISESGRISCPSEVLDIGGRVTADGTYSFAVSHSFIYYDERRDQYKRHTSRSTYTGKMVLDADGNIVGTRDGGNGDSFVWLRR